ncbi:hypothetical protein CAV_0671 [Campylobacter avium LMG 24591]|uniref:Uncharacterized protein n=1 Tax=Campylobacter avium LMG 24591 TaxID=522484 RepID=A0A222MXB0_9BACT|nr:hypothetical protein [Campylobacter avium]ASQ30338.1 hypothetical protein CAV_0671 [Campylobacter avium LMG 24591]OYD79437.1 hypothetical protein CAV8706_0674 [Campylobacter avium]HJE65535.1 hypothetical protein [Campylobacter avium]
MQQWINDFKLAIIDEDVNSIEKLLDTKISSTDMNELRQAKALMDEALTLMQNKKNKVAVQIQKIQKAKKFFEQ